jgi:hypothetical protein
MLFIECDANEIILVIQYNLVKPPPSVQPDFGDKLSKDRKPEVFSCDKQKLKIK